MGSNANGASETGLPTYRIAIIGDGGVGKSALTLQFFQNMFLDEYDPTIEDNYQQHADIDGEVCVLDVLDTAGQEEYAAMRGTYMRRRDGFLVVYSVVERRSFDAVKTFTDQVLRIMDCDSYPMLLVANKVDLADQRTVSCEEGQLLAESLNIDYIETSAKSSLNVKEAFHEIVRIIVRTPTSTNGGKPKKKKNKPFRTSSGRRKCVLL